VNSQCLRISYAFTFAPAGIHYITQTGEFYPARAF